MNFTAGENLTISEHVRNFLNDAGEFQSLLSEHNNGVNAIRQSHAELLAHLNDFLLNARDDGGAPAGNNTQTLPVSDNDTTEPAGSSGFNSCSDPSPNGQAGTETRPLATDPTLRRRHFRFRMKEIYVVATWSDDGLRARVPVRKVLELNNDLQKPLTSIRKRMATRGFVVQTIGQEWEIYHEELNQMNWQNELFNF